MKKQKYNITLKEARNVQRTFRTIALISVVTVLIGVVAMMYLEGWGVVDSIYFSVVSLTTVGYGDITPVTQGGKLFVVFYLIVGIAIIAALINNVLKSFVARRVINSKEEIE